MEPCSNGRWGQRQPLLLVFPFCVWVQLGNRINLDGHQGNLGNLLVKNTILGSARSVALDVISFHRCDPRICS